MQSSGRNAPNAYCTAASAAHTAVSVRKIFAPSAASTNPQAAAEANSASVHPPSGPMATATRATSSLRRADATGSSTSRNGLAPARSESNTFSGAADARNTSHGFAASFMRRDPQPPRLLRGFGEDSLPSFSALPCGGDQTFFASVRHERRDFLHAEFGCFFKRPLKPVKLHDGQKQLDPNSRDSEPAIARRAKIGLRPAPRSLFAQATRSRRRSVHTIARVSARSTRPRWCAASPRRVADPASNFSTKNRLRMCRYVISIRWHRAPSRPAPRCPRPFPHFLLVIVRVLLSGATRAQAPPRPSPLRRAVIIDTDAGADDLMAIAFLLSRPDIHVEAITIVNGMAHVPAGGRNVLRLLALAGRSDIPVYLGK